MRRWKNDSNKPLWKKKVNTPGRRMRENLARIKPGQQIRATKEELGRWIGEFELIEEKKKTMTREPQVDLMSMVESTEKLKDLKTLVKENNEFKEIQDDLDSYTRIVDLRDRMVKLLTSDKEPKQGEKDEQSNNTVDSSTDLGE